jgi:mono/diheme cytochrome c family protein
MLYFFRPQQFQVSGEMVMKICTLALVIVCVMLFISACNKSASENVNRAPVRTPAQTAPAGTPDQFASARAIFKKNCARCHGEDGKGGLKTIDGKKLKIPDLTAGHALGHFDEDFIKQITKGGDGMPAFKDKLTPQEIKELVHLIRHEFQGK